MKKINDKLNKWLYSTKLGKEIRLALIQAEQDGRIQFIILYVLVFLAGYTTARIVSRIKKWGKVEGVEYH